MKFEIKQAQAQAAAIGPQTCELVEKLVNSHWPLKHLRRIQGIMRLVQSKTVGNADLEYAAKQAIRFNKMNYQYIKNAALYFKHHGNRPTLVTPKRSAQDLFLHATH